MKVAIAIIADEQDRILITQRPLHAAHGGCWEFPGGKLEPDESAEDALKREIYEEVGLSVEQSRFISEIKYQYPDKSVHLIFYYVSKFSGTPSCLEGQINMKWVDKKELNPDDFPEANRPIFELI